MNAIQLKAMLWKYPGAVFSSHPEDGVEVFDFWESNSHPEKPTAEEISEACAEYQETDIHIQDSFDTYLAVSRMNQVFSTAEKISLMPYLAGLKDMMNYRESVVTGARNFKDMKEVLLGLVSASLATQEQYDKIKSVLMEQNISLDDF